MTTQQMQARAEDVYPYPPESVITSSRKLNKIDNNRIQFVKGMQEMEGVAVKFAEWLDTDDFTRAFTSKGAAYAYWNQFVNQPTTG